MGNSVFDIFGEINLESKAFEGSLRRSAGSLQNLDNALDKTIQKSNRLGDTSATVARRYEKLSEQIQVQRNRLLDNALAFEKGEINAKKFASIVTSVDKATASLNSKLKDAKVRLVELNETGLTGFQQSVSKAIQDANSKLEAFRKTIAVSPPPPAPPSGGSLFGSLSGQQKTQLSFQLNDIITGLASGQNPLQILAQQGGQIVQVFQQGKVAQEGVAAATTTAATAQAAFAASAKTSAVSQAQVAVSSAATATSMEAAAASSTILGASVVSLGAILAAGLVAIIAVWKATKDIQEAAEKRLKTELAITAEYNRQSEVIGALKKRLAEEAKERAFSAYSGSDDAAGLQIGLINRQRERDAIAAAVEAERAHRNNILAVIPGYKEKGQKDSDEYLAGAVSSEQAKRLKELDDQISKITERLAGFKQEQKEAFNSNVIDGALRSAASAREQVEKQAVEAAKKREELVKKAIEDAKKYAEHVKKAGEAVVGIFASTSNNPFVKIFTDAEDAVQKMREATKGLGKDLQATLEKLLRSQAETKSFAQSLDNALKASNLRQEAKEFTGGGITDASVRQRALNRIFPNYFSSEARERDLQEATKAITKEDFQANIDRQLKAIGAIGGGSRFSSQDFQYDPASTFDLGKYGVFTGSTFDKSGTIGDAITKATEATDPNQRARDQKIIELTKGLADDALTPAQKQQAAAARLREAAALEKEKPDAIELAKKQNKILDDLTKAINEGSIVRIVNEAPDKAKTSTQPRKADSNTFFGN